MFWEYAPADRALTLGAHDADFEKEAWASEVALMHGSSFEGDCGKALLALADDYDRRLSQPGV